MLRASMPRFFSHYDFGSSEHSEEKVYEVCTLGLVGVQHPSELELPVISESNFSTFSVSFLEHL